MKKLLMVLLAVTVLIGCSGVESKNIASENKVEIAVDSSDTKTNNDEAIEYAYSDLKALCDEFWDRWLQETEKLSDAEWYGTSDNEERRNKQFYEVSNQYAKKVFEDFEISQGQKVIVSGYVSKAASSDESALFVQKGGNRIFFYLKHNASDNEYDGISCRTDDESFLDLEDNTPIKIEGVFMKNGDVASNNDLYDCKILEKGEPVDVETNAAYPTAAIVQ